MTNRIVTPRFRGFLFLLFSIFLLWFNSTMAQDKKNETVFNKVAEGLNFPEGPAWDGEGNLYVSSCYGGYITKISGDSVSTFLKASQNPFTLKQTNGLTFGEDGNLYACEFGIRAILKVTTEGKTQIYAAGYNGKKFNRPNDLAFDPEGNLYFSDPNSYDKNNPDGVVYRIDNKTKKVTPAAKDIAFPNGLAFSADAKSLYVCESAEHRVLKFDVDSDGTLANRKVFVTLPGGDPDGIAFDSEGNLYVAHFGNGKIFIIDPNGSIKDSLITPGKKTSNVEFAGDDLKTLYITEDETNSVYETQVKIPGLPLFYSPAYAEEKQ